MRCGANSVNGNAQITVCAVLVSNRETETGCQFAMELGFSGACADGADGDQIGEILRGDGVEHFTGNRDSETGQVCVQLSRNLETLVDVEGFVDVRVIDESLPSYCCARLFKVGAHDDAQVAGEFVGKRF